MSEETREELEQKLEDYKMLVQQPGWKRLMEVAETQIKTREVQLLVSEDDSLEGWSKSRRTAGERSGIKLFTLIPETVIDELTEELRDD